MNKNNENLSNDTSITEENSESSENLDEENLDDENIPDIDGLTLTNKEKFYYRMVNNFFKALGNDKIDNMIDIIEGRSKISLRLLDWFVTRYSNKHKISYKLSQEDDWGFNVHISYKAQLKSYKKRYFDPFRRKSKFYYYFDKEKTKYLATTICQLNFFRWAFSNNIVEYVIKNYNLLSDSMVVQNKEDKKRKLQNKKHKNGKNIKTTDAKISDTKITDTTITENIYIKNIKTNQSKQESAEILKEKSQEKLISNMATINRNGITINAEKKITDNEIKIVLSFD